MFYRSTVPLFIWLFMVRFFFLVLRRLCTVSLSLSLSLTSTEYWQVSLFPYSLDNYAVTHQCPFFDQLVKTEPNQKCPFTESSNDSTRRFVCATKARGLAPGSSLARSLSRPSLLDFSPFSKSLPLDPARAGNDGAATASVRPSLLPSLSAFVVLRLRRVTIFCGIKPGAAPCLQPHQNNSHPFRSSPPRKELSRSAPQSLLDLALL